MEKRRVFELNKTYLEIFQNEEADVEGFRYKMLSSNDFNGIIMPKFRYVNGERRIYIDISGKETLRDKYSGRTLGKEDICSLFEAVYQVSEELSRHLIRETDLWLNPEDIYFNPMSGKYEFICVPDDEDAGAINEGMRSLLQFIAMNMDTKDEKMVTSVYTICDMYSMTNPNFALSYEYFLEQNRCNEIIVEEAEPQIQEELKKGGTRYVPTFKEASAAIMCVTGILLIGANIYLSLI